MNLFIFAVTGYTASQLFYEVSHKPGFPELGRYSLGIIALAVGMKLAGYPNEKIEKFLLEAGAAGLGVALARIL